MKTRELGRLLAALERLTPGQRQLVAQVLEGARSLDEATAIVEKRSAERSVCPKCGAERIVRNGFANGLQRFECRGCNVTFNALTGTALAGLRYRGKWLAHAEALALGLSVRKAAEELGVRPTTSASKRSITRLRAPSRRAARGPPAEASRARRAASSRSGVRSRADHRSRDVAGGSFASIGEGTGGGARAWRLCMCWIQAR